jgi:hypothetical protein
MAFSWPCLELWQQSATEQEETFVRIAEKALEELHITSVTSADNEDQYPADQKSHNDGSVKDGADVAASVAAAEVDDEVPISPSNDLHIPADKDEGAAEAKEEEAPPGGDLHISDTIHQEKKEEKEEGSGTTLPSAAIAEAELIQESKESKEEEESKEESKEVSAGAKDGVQQ